MTRAPRDRARRTTSEATRARILDAARDLAVAEGFGAFTMDRIAERAGMSRLTLYYQFGSRAELLEAMFDAVAARGRMDRMPEAFRETDPLEGLRRMVEVFCGFWASDLEGIRRLRSWAALEGTGVSRDAWQREAIEAMVGRIRARYGRPAEADAAGVIDLLYALLSPDSYERLARGGRDSGEIAALLTDAARALIGLGKATAGETPAT